MPAAVDNAFDVAFWFCDTALNNNEYLQPQKLQRLMFLAQGYHAAAHGGRRLMPAIFVASEMGPIEPHTYAAFAKGRPDIEVNLFMPEGVEPFLEGIWRRFGHISAERLTRMAKSTLAYKSARERGQRAEITIESMCLSFTRGDQTPDLNQVIRPRVLRTQTGRPVTVTAWAPAPIRKGA